MRRAVFAAFAGLVAVFPLSAQTVTGSVDLTAANTRYGDTFSGNSFAISPGLHVDAPSSVFDAGGSYSTLARSWAAQGNASGSLFTPRVSSLMGELAAYATGSSNGDGTHTGSLSGMGRAHVLNDVAGAWLGAGGGRVYNGVVWQNLVQGEVGAWANIPYGSLTAVVTPSKLGDSTKYTDTEGTLSVFRDRIGLDLDAGFRAGSSLPISGGNSRAWGSASGAIWVTPSIAITASAGTYPVNFGQGFPGGRFVSAGIRIGRMPGYKSGNEGAPMMRPDELTPVPGVTAAAVNPLFPGKLRVVHDRAGRTNLSIAAPSASLVEIAGDFSNWEPVALSKTADGRWIASLALKPGIYEMNLRVDRGAWISPPGLESKNDEFGQSVGLLIVPKN